MPCIPDNEVSSPKKLRPNSPDIIPTVAHISIEDIHRICTASNEKCELDILTRELDSLDEDAVFASEHRCSSFGDPQPSLPPLSGLYPFPKRNTTVERCIYIPPKHEIAGPSPVYDENVHTRSKISNDTLRPEIAQGARLEATVIQRVTQLKHQGLWSADRLPKVMEPRQEKSQHEYLMDEVIWLAADFTEERKWKKEIAFQLAKAAQAYLALRQEWNRRCRVAEEQIRMRNASCVALMVKAWWSDVKQSVNDLAELSERNNLDHLAEENKFTLTCCSDLGPSWLARADCNQYTGAGSACEPFDSKQLCHKAFVITSDGESNDDEWIPQLKDIHSDEIESSSNRSSRSTSSSRAASFVDDSDTTTLGVAELRSVGVSNRRTEGMQTIGSHQFDKPDGLNESACVDQPFAHKVTRSFDLIPGATNDSAVSIASSDAKSQHPTDQPVFFDDKELCTDMIHSTELEGLISDSDAPLHHVLRPYVDNGWTVQRSVYCGPAESHVVQDNEIDNSLDFSGCEKTLSKSVRAEVSALLAEASLPLDEVVSLSYLQQSASIEETSLRTGVSSNHTGSIITVGEPMDQDVFDGSVHDESESLELETTNTGGTAVSRLRSDSIDADSSNPYRMIFTQVYPDQLCHPVDLHEAALSLSPLLRQFPLWSEKSASALMTTGWNPAFRARVLPSCNFGAVVAWLRQAFIRTVPGLILSPSPMSGDAELAVAAHLGQLTIPDIESHKPILVPGTNGSNPVGHWGPHLIVTSRLCLPVWRSRLLNWCPGLKIASLGLATDSDPPGTGRRLRAGVARGAVNICLTTYAAVRARPSRYCRIQWSVIVLDQVHNLLQHLGSAVNHGELHPQPVIKSEDLLDAQANGKSYSTLDASLRFSSLKTEQSNASTKTGHSIPALLDLFTSELKFSGHRLLISSVPDLCPSLCGYRLYLLSRLLLLKDPINSSSYRNWVTELFKAATASQRRRVAPSSGHERPSKRQLNKFIEPFIVRLDEDDEWEALVDEEIISCPMTANQCQLHDAALSTKSARNASKSGDLLDLLRTVSLASRVCSHPCLAATQPQNSQRFQNVLQDLCEADCPAGPFVFRVPSMDTKHDESELVYTTPEAVLRAVRSLRESDSSDTTSSCLHLCQALQLQSSYIRHRIASLIPTSDQFEAVFSPGDSHYTNSSQPRSRVQPIVVDGYNGINRRNVTIQAVGDSRNDDDFLTQIRSKLNSHLANGLPEPMDTWDSKDIVKQLDFASIPVKTKRPRSVSGFQTPDPLLPTIKRRRLDGGGSRDNSPLKRFSCSGHEKTASCAFPFLGPELLVQLEKEMLNPSTSKHGNEPQKYSGSFLPRQGSYVSHTSDKVNGANLSENLSLNGRMDASPSVLHLTQRNTWRCTQSTDVSDWCSIDSCAMLQFDQRFFQTVRTNPIPTPGKPLALMEHLQLHLLQDLSIWNLPSSYISQIPVRRLLCSRSPVIASTPRLAGPSAREPVCHTCEVDGRVSVVAPSCQFPSYSTTSSQSALPCLSCSLNLLYPFCERSRWLSSVSVNHGCFNHWADSTQRGLTPCSRLFYDSGKFLRLNQLLNTILNSSKADRPGGRPRCIYLLAHQNALLDLLEAFLAASWRSYPRVRLPCDENSLGAQSMLLIDRINGWPRGSCEPMIVLLHSRCFAGLLSGLRAGADTNVIVCDVDWRSDTTDMLRFLFHSWALNGLVDVTKPIGGSELCRPGLRIYRLVSSMTVGSTCSVPSMEACLSRGMACRLLPGAVFLAHTSTSDESSLWSARVQPNVVNELLSCGPVGCGEETQTVAVKPFIKATEVDRDLPCLIKPEAMSCSSSSSVASSFSFYPSAVRRRGDQMRCDDDETAVFQEREPLSEELLHRAFELFEDPIDVQAWCFGVAEATLLMNDLFGEHLPITPVECNQNAPVSDEVDVRAVGFLTRQPTCLTNSTESSGLRQQFDYSDLEMWEVAHFESQDFLSTLEDQCSSTACSLLTYEEMPPDQMTSILLEDRTDNLWLPTTTPNKIPIWEPFLPDVEPKGRSRYVLDPSAIEPYSGMVESRQIVLDQITDISVTKMSVESDETDWGYESEPMTEQELPPVTLPTVTSVVSALPGTVTNLKRSESSLNAQNQAEKPTDVGVPSTIASRMSFTGSSLKRRKMANASCSRRTAIADQVPPSPSTPEDHSIQMPTPGEDSDVSMVPSPCSISSTSRSAASTREVVPGFTNSNVTCSTGFSTGSAIGASTTGNNSSGTVLMTLHSQTGNTNGISSRIHIPRATYNKEIGSARNNRLRRPNTISNSNTNATAAAVAAMAAGAQLAKASPYHVQNSQTSAASSFSTPASASRYGHTSPGRSAQNLSAPTAIAGRYVTGSQTAPGQTQGQGNTAQGLACANQLHVGKPLEWLPHEEAALYLCISKLQDLAFESGGNGSNNSASAHLNTPNFRLAEFFMNNYVPTRGYRGARQCLLMHAKMLVLVATATAALSVNAFNFPQTVSALGLLSGEDGTLSASSAPSHGGTTHGPTGRKVKNKLKSAAAAAAAAAGISGASQQGSVNAGTGPSASPSGGSATDSANAVNRYRTYLAYQLLQSCCSSNSTGTSDNGNTGLTFDCSTSTPTQLHQLFANMKAADDSHARIIRKAVLDSLLSTHLMPVSQPYRATASRRPIASGLSGSPHMVSLGSAYTVGSSAYPSGGGSSGSMYGHHHGSGSSFTSVPLGHVGHAPTAPALLTHHRHHRHPTVHDQASSSTNDSNVSSGGSTSSLSHAGPIIQKNPTHIAALQEHNINPDTLITPAMVIKNKEEREARMRAEALSAANLISSVSSSLSANTPPAASTASTSVYHQSQANVHNTDPAHSQSGQLSLQLDTGGPGIVATLPLPMSLTGGHLSFAHPNNQRGTSVMLPVRCGFGNHSLASGSTVISLAHVGGPQRILGGSTVSSTVGPGQLLSHQSKHQQQILNPSMSRLSHFGGTGTLDLMGSAGLNTHTVSSTGAITSSNTVDTDSLGVSGIGEAGSSNIVLPASWRASSVSRNFGVQNSRISSLSANQAPSSTAIPVTGTYLTTQVTKSTAPTGYFLQQRPQFLSTTQPSMSTRSILTSPSSSGTNPGMVVGGNYGSSITSLPHILRPRSALRGSVIQPAFVRTITATSTSTLSVVPHQTGPRLSSSSANFAHSRVSLAVSSNSASVSQLLSSRAGIRTQSSAVFQQFRPGNQATTVSGSAPVTFSFSSQVGSGATAATDGRHFIGQHQTMPVQQVTGGCGPNTPGVPFSCVGPSDSNNIGNRQSDTEPYVVTRFHQTPPQ